MSKKYDLAKLLVLVAEIRNEEAMLRQELADRQRKGLSGNAAKGIEYRQAKLNREQQ